MSNEEKMIFSNSLGSVTDQRVILNYKNGTEHIALAQISSVRYKHVRSLFFSLGGYAVSIIVLLFMLSMIDKMSGVFVLICCIIIIIGVLSGLANWYGHHEIVISVGGQDRKPLKAELSKTREGRELSDAIKKVMSRSVA